MKLYKVLLSICLLMSTLIFNSCEDADDRYVHTDTKISAIYARDKIGGIEINGVFEGENSEKIFFNIPTANMNDVNIKSVMIYGSIPVSAKVRPSFAGRHDLSQPKTFTVVNDDNKPRTYIIQARYTDN